MNEVTHPIDWSSSDGHDSLRKLDIAHYNLAGQAVDWLSEAEVRGFDIPEHVALDDAAFRGAYAPWMAGLEAPEDSTEPTWQPYFPHENAERGRYLHLPPSDESSTDDGAGS